MALDPISIGATLLGGLLGGQSSNTNSSASREPWAPAQPWLKSNIDTGQQLQAYYQQNPFNALQQQGYDNLFSDLNNFRSNMAPGLLGLANSMTGSNYQRQQGPVGSIGYSNPSNSQPSQSSQPVAPFSMPAASPINWQAMNPFSSIKPPAAPAAPAARPAMTDQRGGGNDAPGARTTPDWGTAFQIGQMIGSKAIMEAALNGMLAQSGAYARAADALPSFTDGLLQGYDGPGSNQGGYGEGLAAAYDK